MLLFFLAAAATEDSRGIGGPLTHTVADFAPMGYASPYSARPPPPPPPPINPELAKLELKYDTLRNATCAKVVAEVPTLDAADSAAFMSAYQSYMGNGSEAAVIAAAGKLTNTAAVAAFLSLADTAGSGGLDATMVQCALMTDAHRGSAEGRTVAGNLLAQFAFLGAAEETLVDQLLASPAIMLDMLVAGGVVTGHYGEAFAIWTKLQKASSALRAVVATTAATTATPDPWDDRATDTVLKRLAVGVSLAHAVPVAARWNTNLPNASKFVDPVARYQHYEGALANGDLDPSFASLTSFELAHTVDGDMQDMDMTWVRATMANFRPDNIAMDYHWRYIESVHTEVAYGDSSCGLPGWEGVCNGHYSDIPVGGDVCGGRAFWGRFVAKSFGRPTWGATEHAHAAMSAWTPTGWTVLLGAPWPDCWWGPRGGQDFVLETLARDNRPAFQKVLRAGWVAKARNDAPIDMMWSVVAENPANGKGGLWSALSLYLTKSVVAASPAPNRTFPTAPANNKITQLLAKFAAPPAPPAPVTTAADGTITIPAASFSSKNKTAQASVLVSAAAGTQLLSNGCASAVGPPCLNPESSAVNYAVTSAAGGDYYFTANFSTYHMNQDLFVSVNGGKAAAVAVHYTVGWWNETQPVPVTLTKGGNTITLTWMSGRDVSFKEFFLYTKKPTVPPSDPHFAPVPAPPSPPSSAYIEVSADTTCVKQGIQPVSEEDCGHACLALGFDSTGDRERANISGCFVMTTGPYAGNCNYNTNKSATCTPPCTLMGAVVRSLCERV